MKQKEFKTSERWEAYQAAKRRVAPWEALAIQLPEGWEKIHAMDMRWVGRCILQDARAKWLEMPH